MPHCWKSHALAHYPVMFVYIQEKVKEGYAKANTEMQLWESYLTVSLTLYVLWILSSDLIQLTKG